MGESGRKKEERDICNESNFWESSERKYLVQNQESSDCLSEGMYLHCQVEWPMPALDLRQFLSEMKAY